MRPDDTTSRGVIDLNGTAEVSLDASGEVTATGWTTPTYYVDDGPGPRKITHDWHHVVITSATGITASAFDIGPAAGSYYEGRMDDVRAFGRVLSPQEVKRLYDVGLGVTIVPPASFTCGVSTVQDQDGNTYHTRLIGTQCWMQENMGVGTRVNVATTQTDNGVIEKWCYGDSDTNCTTNDPNYPDGGLYQWNEAMQYSTTPGAFPADCAPA